jgi:hypothetical protein
MWGHGGCAVQNFSWLISLDSALLIDKCVDERDVPPAERRFSQQPKTPKTCPNTHTDPNTNTVNTKQIDPIANIDTNRYVVHLCLPLPFSPRPVVMPDKSRLRGRVTERGVLLHFPSPQSSLPICLAFSLIDYSQLFPQPPRNTV